MMIVQNISGKEIKIPELRQIIGAGSGYISMPYNIAFKYRKFLRPVQMSDTLLQNKIDKDEVKLEVVDNQIVKQEVEDLVRRTDLEEETIMDVMRILKEEFNA